MARTKDPHAATVKAWKTRARNAGGGGVVQQRGDFAHGVDVGSSKRMDAKSSWSSPGFVRKTIAAAARATRDDIKAGRVPGVKLGDPAKVGSQVLAQYQPDGTVLVFDRPEGTSFFKGSTFGNEVLMSHEFGHEVSLRAFSGGTASERTAEALKPFRKRPDDPWVYDNFSGLSSRGEEFLADVYSDLFVSKRQPWEAGSTDPYTVKISTVYKHVLGVARKAGLPMPVWAVG